MSDVDVIRVEVHPGMFHADDVTAVAILGLVHGVDNLEIFRTPQEVLTVHYRVDTGREYDYNHGWFDHHQQNAPKRDDGNPYAAAGLVWKHLGRLAISNHLCKSGDGLVDEIWERIDREVILPIDRADNGVGDRPEGLNDLSAIISALNPPPGTNPGDTDMRFFQGVEFMHLYLRARVQSIGAEIGGRVLAEKVMKWTADTYPGRRFLIFPTLPLGWQKTVLEGDPNGVYLYVIFRDDLRGDWKLQAVPDKVGGFGMRAPIPEGVTSLAGCTFLHNARFIAAFSTREDAEAAVVRITTAAE